MTGEELDAGFTAALRDHRGDYPGLLAALREVAEQHATDIHRETRA